MNMIVFCDEVMRASERQSSLLICYSFTPTVAQHLALLLRVEGSERL